MSIGGVFSQGQYRKKRTTHGVIMTKRKDMKGAKLGRSDERQQGRPIYVPIARLGVYPQSCWFLRDLSISLAVLQFASKFDYSYSFHN